MVIRPVIANNGRGIVVAAATIVRVGQSTLTGNATSWSASAVGALRSYGDNNIAGNGDGDPAPPTIAKK